MDVYFLFEWLDASLLATISKAYGGVFAMVQTVHLGSIALLGGMVLVSDLRLLNLVLTGVPVSEVMASTRRWITVALVLVTLSGVYQASAVAIKLYYNTSFWAKMAGFFLGIVFIYWVKLPLVRQGTDVLNPWTVRLLAITSLVIWFSVAATGRWIGFS